jgi:hypothetical protein
LPAGKGSGVVAMFIEQRKGVVEAVGKGWSRPSARV